MTLEQLSQPQFYPQSLKYMCFTTPSLCPGIHVDQAWNPVGIKDSLCFPELTRLEDYACIFQLLHSKSLFQEPAFPSLLLIGLRFCLLSSSSAAATSTLGQGCFLHLLSPLKPANHWTTVFLTLTCRADPNKWAHRTLWLNFYFLQRKHGEVTAGSLSIRGPWSNAPEKLWGWWGFTSALLFPRMGLATYHPPPSD